MISATIVAASCATDTPTMIPPIDRIAEVSPVTTPSSTISAFRVGTSSIAMVCTNCNPACVSRLPR
jgi:hypothetical protein